MLGKVRVGQVFKVGPKKVARIGRNQAAIYLPKDLVFLRGRKVMVTIEVLEEMSDK